VTQPETSRTDSLPVVKLPIPEHCKSILDEGALELLSDLARRYRKPVDDLLEARLVAQRRFNTGQLPGFDESTRQIRESDWTVAPIPEDLKDRRVEITGPVDRKMIINALNSDARVFMADFEDSSSPTWTNMLEGQVNLRDAVRGDIGFTGDNGKEYRLKPDPAVLKVRPRGWHLDEKHMEVDGRPVPAGIFDAAVYLYHNASALIEKGTGPYLYLPKLENHREAALWQQVLTDIEARLGLDEGSIRVTVLIECITAVFEMDEILHALKNRIVGLNCGRWDYIFSYIKRLQAHPDRVLPDRNQVTMTVPFLRAYSRLLVKTCHRRGAFAMGGMAAQIPVRDDEDANRQALDKVRADKEREVGDGHDGTWVAHPGLIPLAMEIFDRKMSGPNQLDRLEEDVEVTASELLEPAKGEITLAGIRGNISVAVRYLAAWLAGKGCVPIDNLMEDAATAEIARSQLWQWIRHPGGHLADGTDITLEGIRTLLDEVLHGIRQELGEEAFAEGHYEAAASLLDDVTASDEFVEFITLPAYDRLN